MGGEEKEIPKSLSWPQDPSISESRILSRSAQDQSPVLPRLGPHQFSLICLSTGTSSGSQGLSTNCSHRLCQLLTMSFLIGLSCKVKSLDNAPEYRSDVKPPLPHTYKYFLAQSFLSPHNIDHNFLGLCCLKSASLLNPASLECQLQEARDLPIFFSILTAKLKNCENVECGRNKTRLYLNVKKIFLKIRVGLGTESLGQGDCLPIVGRGFKQKSG